MTLLISNYYDSDSISYISGESLCLWLYGGFHLTPLQQRQKFIASFTHETLREAVVWRLKVLKPAISAALGPSTSRRKRVTMSQSPGLSALRCLSLDYVDNLGRPLAVLRVSELDFTTDSELLKRNILLSLERLRVSVQRMNERKALETAMDAPAEGVPVLQYVVVLDLENVSTKSIVSPLLNCHLLNTRAKQILSAY